MSRVTRLLVASVILTPLFFAPVTVARSSDGLLEVQFTDACAFDSCAPRPGWHCIHWYPDGTVDLPDMCDPNSNFCVVEQT